MENNNRPSLEEQQAYTIRETEGVLRVEYQLPLLAKSKIEPENIALGQSHYIQKFFETYRYEYDHATVAEDAKNLAEYLTVFQKSISNILAFVKNEQAQLAAKGVNGISIDSLRQYAIGQHAKAFSVLHITPERYEGMALAEKEHWRRMAVASTRAYNREQAKNE